jgi:uncharacterized membrane protein
MTGRSGTSWKASGVAFISRVFIKGLITLLPITLTLALIIWVATRAEWMFGEPLRQMVPEAFYFPGAGVFLAVILIFLVGLAVNNFLTNRFVAFVETQIERLPVIKTIYSPLRDVTQLFARKDQPNAQRVVMVRMGEVETMGLITRDTFTDLPLGTIPPDHVAVFLPFSYGVGGFTVIVARSHVRETSLPAEKALQLSITGWIKG